MNEKKEGVKMVSWSKLSKKQKTTVIVSSVVIVGVGASFAGYKAYSDQKMKETQAKAKAEITQLVNNAKKDTDELLTLFAENDPSMLKEGLTEEEIKKNEDIKAPNAIDKIQEDANLEGEFTNEKRVLANPKALLAELTYKFGKQQEVNHFFDGSDDKLAMDGPSVNKEISITKELKKEEVEDFKKSFSDYPLNNPEKGSVGNVVIKDNDGKEKNYLLVSFIDDAEKDNLENDLAKEKMERLVNNGAIESYNYQNEFEDNSKDGWYVAVTGLADEAIEQLDQIEKTNKTVDGFFKEDKAKTDVKRKDFEAAEKEVKKIKQADAKKSLEDKLSKVKKAIEDREKKEAEEKKKKEAAEKKKQEEEAKKAAEAEQAQAEAQNQESFGTSQGGSSGNASNTGNSSSAGGGSSNGGSSSGGGSGNSSGASTGGGNSGGSTGGGASTGGGNSGGGSSTGGNSNSGGSNSGGGAASTPAPSKPTVIASFGNVGGEFGSESAAYAWAEKNITNNTNSQYSGYAVGQILYSDGTVKWGVQGY